MSTAFFPGKFQPVHLGHIVTLMNLYEKYNKIIIGITEDKPNILSQKKRKEIFESVFKYLPKFEIVLIKGTIVNSRSLEHLPDFDICLTGNPQVIEKLNEFRLKTEMIERSIGIGYSGSEIRSLLKEKLNEE